MLCKIWGFSGDDYEECRLLGYKSPVRTSLEIYYVSATESRRLIQDLTISRRWLYLKHLTSLQACTACYSDSFTFLYADDVRTSLKTHLWAPTACYGDSFTFLYADDVRTSLKTHLWATTACYGDSFTFLYADDVRTSLKTHLWASTACYGNSFSDLNVDHVRTSHQRASMACYGDSFTFYFTLHYTVIGDTTWPSRWEHQMQYMLPTN
jgi:hypothetical protein